ncbi:MAG: hypothetical protein AAF517_25575 [Planctomycetota bacterium]
MANAAANKDESIAAAVATTAVSLALKGAKALIEKEGSKYEASWTKSREIYASGLNVNDFFARKIETGGAWIVIRTFDPKKRTTPAIIDKLPVLNEDGKGDLKQQIRKALIGDKRDPKNDRLIKDLETFISDTVEEATSNPRSADEHFCLALAAAGWITPAPKPVNHPGASPPTVSTIPEAMKIHLRGYTYPALTAKRLPFGIPFVSWDRVQSALTLQIQGPQSDFSYGGNRYNAAATFVLFQDEFRKEDGRRAKKSDEHRVGTWVTFDTANKAVKAAWSSSPLAIPSSKALVLAATVTESSKLKERILDLAERVGDIEVDAEDLGIE